MTNTTIGNHLEQRTLL